MLDKYLEGRVFRINPEAPVPVVFLKDEFNELGGAGNVAANITALGGEVFLFAFVGNDEGARIIQNLLEEKGVSSFLDTCNQTIEKTRILGEGQQLIRYDREESSEKFFSERRKRELTSTIEKADVIVISDYAKGAITKDLMELISPFNNKTIVDPKPRNKMIYKGVFLIKPNEKEAIEMSSCMDLNMASNNLRKDLETNILLTRGEKGMSLFSEKVVDIPTHAKDVFDVTGAGDTVIATLAMAIAASASLEEAAILANHAAGIVIERKGTCQVSLNKLKKKILHGEKKILGFEEIKKIVEDNKRKGRKVVWTNGCFDLLHVGHTRYLREAKKLGDLLIVGLNSNESVKRIKGENRPLQSEEERAEILASLASVDHILIFPELTVEKYLGELKPDIFAKGGDRTLEFIRNHKEGEIVESYGGEIKIVSLAEGRSSSNILKKIQDHEAQK